MAWQPTTIRPGLWRAPAERSGDGALALLQTAAQTSTSATSSRIQSGVALRFPPHSKTPTQSISWSAPAERSGDGALARPRKSRKPRFSPHPPNPKRRGASLPASLQNAGAIHFLECAGRAQRRRRFGAPPDRCANLDLRHVLRIQSGVALRFPPHSKTLASPLAVRFVIVMYLQLVDLEAVDCPHLRRGGGALEPRRRTPRILIGHRHQPMLHRILMNVVEPRPI